MNTIKFTILVLAVLLLSACFHSNKNENILSSQPTLTEQAVIERVVQNERVEENDNNNASPSESYPIPSEHLPALDTNISISKPFARKLEDVYTVAPTFFGDSFSARLEEKALPRVTFDTTDNTFAIQKVTKLLNELFGGNESNSILNTRNTSNFRFEKANVKELARLFCDVDPTTLSIEDQAVCRVLTNQPKAGDEQLYENCDGAPPERLYKDLPVVNLYKAQQEVCGLEIEEANAMITQLDGSNKAFVFGTLYRKKHLNLPDNLDPLNCRKTKGIVDQEDIDNINKNQSFDTSCSKTYAQCINDDFNLEKCLADTLICQYGDTNATSEDGINSCDPITRGYSDEPKKSWVRWIGQQSNDSGEHCSIVNERKGNSIDDQADANCLDIDHEKQPKLNLELNSNYLCEGTLQKTTGSWTVLINEETGKINKLVPQFAYANQLHEEKRDLWAWPVNPEKDKANPHKYKNITTRGKLNKLMQSGIFNLVKNPTGKSIELSNHHLRPKEKDCDIGDYEDRQINVFTHLDRIRQMASATGLCCSGCSQFQPHNECNLDSSPKSINFPTVPLGIEMDSNKNEGDWDEMKLSIGNDDESKRCLAPEDTTLIAHEFAHILVNDTRKQLGLDGLNLAAHDLTDTITYAYTGDTTVFDWAQIDIERTLDTNDTLFKGKIFHNNTPYLNDQIFGSMFKSWNERSQQECKITHQIRNWVRLNRTALTFMPLAHTCNDTNCSEDVLNYRIIKQLLMVYLSQMKGMHDEYLISEYLGRANQHGITLLPWVCLDGNIETKSDDCKSFAKKQLATNVTITTDLHKNGYTVTLSETPKIRFLPNNVVTRTADDACFESDIWFQKSSDRYFSSRTEPFEEKQEKKRLCEEDHFIPIKDILQQEYIRAFTNIIHAELGVKYFYSNEVIPFLGSVSPMKITKQYINKLQITDK